MGKIIVNGIEFCGTSDTADNIIYDNKESDLEATTVQDAIDELVGGSLNTNNNTALIEGTCPSAPGETVFYDYPEGFNTDNCMVVNIGFNHSNQWYYNMVVNISPRVILADKIQINSESTANTVWNSKPFRLLLQKIS